MALAGGPCSPGTPSLGDGSVAWPVTGPSRARPRIAARVEARGAPPAQMALSQAKEDADRDRRNKETKRRQMMEYRAQLEQLALKEKEDSEEQDRLIQEQNKIQQAKHDVQKRAEEEARQALMREVVETRAQQLQVTGGLETALGESDSALILRPYSAMGGRPEPTSLLPLRKECSSSPGQWVPPATIDGTRPCQCCSPQDVCAMPEVDDSWDTAPRLRWRKAVEGRPRCWAVGATMV